MSKAKVPQVFLGIDPGSRVVGWGALRWHGGCRVSLLDFGCLKVRSDEAAEKLKQIYRRVLELLTEIRPDAVIVEEVFYGKSFQSALRIGEARGVCILAAAEKGIPTFSYSPAEVKTAVTGNGRAHKSQVQAMVKQLLGLSEVPQPEDAADALACALCHTHRLNVER